MLLGADDSGCCLRRGCFSYFFAFPNELKLSSPMLSQRTQYCSVQSISECRRRRVNRRAPFSHSAARLRQLSKLGRRRRRRRQQCQWQRQQVISARAPFLQKLGSQPASWATLSRRRARVSERASELARDRSAQCSDDGDVSSNQSKLAYS